MIEDPRYGQTVIRLNPGGQEAGVFVVGTDSKEHGVGGVSVPVEIALEGAKKMSLLMRKYIDVTIVPEGKQE